MHETGRYTLKAPWWQYNGFVQTIAPAVLRRTRLPEYTRERITTPDDDFLDLDWLLQPKHDALVILSHGLEGNTQKGYIRAMAKAFFEQHYSVLAWNNRSCSGEMSRTLKVNHHGEVDDIDWVVRHALQRYAFKKVYLIGFSLGGSIVLNYVARSATKLPSEIKGAVAFSTPCDLRSASETLDFSRNKFFYSLFFKRISENIVQKEAQFPGTFDLQALGQIKNWKDFDDQFCAKLCGFSNGPTFYEEVSCLPHLHKIQIDTLLVNADNDPILTEKCHPFAVANQSKNFRFILTDQGGHIGFEESGLPMSFMERSALEFFNQ